MIFWLTQVVMTFFVVFILGLAGFGISTLCLRHHQQKIPYGVLASPLFAFIILPIPLIIFYDIGLSLKNAALLSLIAMCVFSLFHLHKKNFSISLKSIVFIVLIGVLAANFFANYGALHTGGPYVMFHDGTDTLGYANNADWLQDHYASQVPTMDAASPYGTLPSINLKADQRLGTYMYLALTALFAHLPALFSYQLAITIYLVVSVLGLAACVSRRRSVFVFTSLALLSTSWFQLAFLGFLGKFFIIPVVFFILLLVLKRVFDEGGSIKTSLLIGLAIGASSLYPYPMLMLIMLSALLVCMLMLRWKKNIPTITLLLALFLLFFATSGGLASMGKQTVFGQTWVISTHFKPWELLFSIFSMKYFSRSTVYGSFESYIDCGLLFAVILCQLVFIGMAWRARSRVAFILFVGPLLLLSVMYFGTHNLWGISQLAVIPYFATILGIATLFEASALQEHPRLKTGAKFLVGLFILLHASFIIFILHRDILTPPSWAIYQQSEYRQIKKIIGDQEVLINTKGIYDSQPFFLEFGREGKHIFMTKQAWDLTNWGLPCPAYPSTLRYQIISLAAPIPVGWHLIEATKHYQILIKENQS